MSKTHRIDGLNRRINRLEARIKCDQSELATLKQRLARMTANPSTNETDKQREYMERTKHIDILGW